jgi:hypothetical protein
VGFAAATGRKAGYCVATGATDDEDDDEDEDKEEDEDRDRDTDTAAVEKDAGAAVNAPAAIRS